MYYFVSGSFSIELFTPQMNPRCQYDSYVIKTTDCTQSCDCLSGTCQCDYGSLCDKRSFNLTNAFISSSVSIPLAGKSLSYIVTCHRSWNGVGIGQFQFNIKWHFNCQNSLRLVNQRKFP